MFRKPLILITGSNGWIGLNAQQALEQHYQLILVDSHDASNPKNRFGLEGIDSSLMSNTSKHPFTKLDLATDRKAFEDLIKSAKPDCVIHLAGILENQPIETINNNLLINQNVLEASIANNIPVVAASSIMVMYGAALNNYKVQMIFERNKIALTPEERLTVEEPFKNSEENIKLFNEENWKQNHAYIKTKEALENLAANLTSKNSNTTVVAVRFGWTGIKNPFEIEANGKITEIPVYLDSKDLQSFLKCLVTNILQQHIAGFKKYVCTSVHPQNWADMGNVSKEIGWLPSVNVLDRYVAESKQGESKASPASQIFSM